MSFSYPYPDGNTFPYPNMNMYKEGCVTCVHADNNPPEDADWWIRCKIGKNSENVYTKCDAYTPVNVYGRGM